MADWVTQMGLGYSSTDDIWRVSDKWGRLLLRGLDSEAVSSEETEHGQVGSSCSSSLLLWLGGGRCLLAPCS